MTSDPNLFFHKSVLVEEVVTYLNPQPGKIYVDCTFGSGGHTKAILEREPTCKVVAIDWDAVSLETYGPLLQEQFGDRLQLIWGNFSLLYKLLKKNNITQVDGILADFGTSQMHLKERAGFSFAYDSDLDMRMSPAHQPITAAQVINEESEAFLRNLFWQLGEERYAKQIAAAIVQDRKRKPFVTTGQLASLIERIVPFDKKRPIHPATRVFQALRIYINKELDNITSLLSAAMDLLSDEGRIVCISFHSLEDRLVKQFFKQQEQAEALELLTKKIVVATPEEIKKNPSARSARLRAAQRTKK